MAPLAPIRFVDRSSGEIRTEKVAAEAPLRWLYHSAPGRLLAHHLLSRPLLSAAYGRWQDSRWSRRQVARFARDLDIDVSEAERALADYRSLNDFFSRRLRPQARPVDGDPAALVAPADGRVLALPALASASPVELKGGRVSAAEVLDDPPLAARVADGPALIVRLAPADYHRFHFLADAVPQAPRRIAGRLDSVSPLALGAQPDVFTRNQREVTVVRTESCGDVVYVEIGAMLVGSIVQTFIPEKAVRRGDEKGYFQFGGSTVLVLFTPGQVAFDEDLVGWTRQGLETYVKFGSRIGRIL